MVARARLLQARVLPHGWPDALRQVSLFMAAYLAYRFARGLVEGRATAAFQHARELISLERTLHVFVEPSVQAWASGSHFVMVSASWLYVNAQTSITITALAYLYMRHNRSFYFVRNMFMIAMAIALVGYALYPTAPPRLMPEWGFTDSISQFMGLGTTHFDTTPTGAFVNAYAAVPSMHVCFAIITGWSMAKLVKRRISKILWSLYPLLITFAVVATGNHYFTDVFLGALTAGVSALLAKQLLARARPDVWAFNHAPV
jgi:membrane-associated phospholipid phosphatase